MRGLGDATFQTKRGADYKAQVKDGFARVELVGEPAYITSGKYRAAKPAGVFAATDYRAAFAPSRDTAGVNCDYGASANLQVFGTDTVSLAFPYPNILAGQPDTNGAFNFIATGQRNRVSGKVVGEAINNTCVSLAGGTVFLYPQGIRIVYFGRELLAGEAELRIGCFYLENTGRTDGKGRPLFDPAVAYFFRRAAPTAFLLPLPAGEREYEVPQAVVSRSAIYVICAEKFIRYGARDAAADLRPPVWLLASGNGGSTWGRVDIRAVLADDFDLPRQNVAKFAAGPEGATGFYGMDQIPLVDGRATITDTATYSEIQDYAVSTGPLVTAQRAVNPFGVADWAAYNSRLSFTVQLMQMVMCADGAALVTFPYQKTIAGVARWKSRVVRVSNLGATVETTFTSTTTATDTEYVQSIVYVGLRTLVAKKVKGFAGTGFAVVFMVSTDNGGTWADVQPTGFDCPLQNQYFGDLFVERARTAEHGARILLVSFDTARGAYHVYSSDDLGATWSRRGKVRRPDQFYRIDRMLASDDGSNFQTISDTGSARGAYPVDRALPDRYIRKVQP